MAKRIRELKTEVVATGKEKHVYRIFELIKRKESLAVADQTTHFNNTELRLIAEVLAAKYVGKRLSSTQLAQLLGVTRSAISQIVNRLEKNGVVKRVADDVDRKIAYIELSENAQEKYEQAKNQACGELGEIISAFGVAKFEKLCDLAESFTKAVAKQKAKSRRK
jgi:DNA-binding MarR family transcriptional regulator